MSEEEDREPGFRRRVRPDSEYSDFTGSLAASNRSSSSVWDPESLRRMVNNAYAGATNLAGTYGPALGFDPNPGAGRNLQRDGQPAAEGATFQGIADRAYTSLTDLLRSYSPFSDPNPPGFVGVPNEVATAQNRLQGPLPAPNDPGFIVLPREGAILDTNAPGFIVPPREDKPPSIGFKGPLPDTNPPESVFSPREDRPPPIGFKGIPGEGPPPLASRNPPLKRMDPASFGPPEPGFVEPQLPILHPTALEKGSTAIKNEPAAKKVPETKGPVPGQPVDSAEKKVPAASKSAAASKDDSSAKGPAETTDGARIKPAIKGTGDTTKTDAGGKGAPEKTDAPKIKPALKETGDANKGASGVKNGTEKKEVPRVTSAAANGIKAEAPSAASSLPAKSPKTDDAAIEKPVKLKTVIVAEDTAPVGTRQKTDGAAAKSETPVLPDRKVKFGYEQVRTLPPEKKRDKNDFNERVEDELGILRTKPTSSKESLEYIESLMKEAAKKASLDNAAEKKSAVQLRSESTRPSAATAVTDKSVCHWAATPAEANEYQQFQNLLHKSSSDAVPESKTMEATPKPAVLADEKLPASGQTSQRAAPDKAGKDEAGKEDRISPVKKSDKGEELLIPKKPIASKAGKALSGTGPHGKASDLGKRLRRMLRRKPADEESSSEDLKEYPEFDDEYVDFLEKDMAAAGEAVPVAARAVDRRQGPEGSPETRLKLNAYALACSGTVIFVFLLLVLLSGDLFDDLDQSVPTFDIDLATVVNRLDEPFLGAGLSTSLMGKPAVWGTLLERPDNDSLMVLLKALAPGVLRFAGHETDHFYFVDGGDADDDAHAPRMSRLRLQGKLLEAQGPI